MSVARRPQWALDPGLFALDARLLLVCLSLSVAMVQLSSRVLAQGPGPGEARVRVLPEYEEAFRQKVYVGAGAWRDVPDDQRIWRQNRKEAREGRIEFGYDSSYEAMRARGTLEESGTGLRDPKPATVFRLRF